MDTKVRLFVFFITITFQTIVGIKLTTLKHCCELGTGYASSGLKCSTFQTPVAGIPKEDEPRCLNSIQICCKNEYREKQCELGNQDAKNGRDCINSEDITSGNFRKDCCQACQFGIETGSTGQSCQSILGLGEPYDSAFTACCREMELTPSVPSTSSVTTPSTTSKSLPVSLPSFNTTFGSFSTPPYKDDAPLPPIENLCDIGEVCAQICIPTKDSFKCDCNKGYTLMADGVSCKQNKRSPVRVNRCEEHSPCEQKCTDTGVSIQCSCYDGYELAKDKRTCRDIDECELGIHTCLPNEMCVNEDGNYYCEDPNELEDDLSISDFDSKCPEGYKFDGENKLCNDIDECEISIICPRPKLCINTVGSFRCEGDDMPKCPPGFYFKDSIQDCEDIDECISGQNDCNRESQVCLNTKGNFTCIDKASKRSCPAGFKKNPNTQACEDINECEESEELCAPNELCVNEPGGHTCITKSPALLSPTRPISGQTQPDTGSSYFPRVTYGTSPRPSVPQSIKPYIPQNPATTEKVTRPTVTPFRAPIYTRPTSAEPIYSIPSQSFSEKWKKPEQQYSPPKKTYSESPQSSKASGYTQPTQQAYIPPAQPTRETYAQPSQPTQQSYAQPSQPTQQSYAQPSQPTQQSYAQPSQPPQQSYAQPSQPTQQSYVQPSQPAQKSYVQPTQPQQKPSEPLQSSNPSQESNSYSQNPAPQPTQPESAKQPHSQPVQPTYRQPPSYPYPSEPSHKQPYYPQQNYYQPQSPTSSQRTYSQYPSTPISCPAGYRYTYEHNRCVDVDECLEDYQSCDSSQDCYNTPGSFICTCKSGFTKDYATRACVDVNECQVGTHDCVDGQRCDNTIGSFLCSRTAGCGTGYTLNYASGLCEDDDECELGTHNCNDLGPKFQCKNTLGSYRCQRISRPEIPKYVHPKVEPSRNYPIFSGQNKKCLPGYVMNRNGDCEDIDECESNPCRRGEKCRNLNGRYQCIPAIQCKHGFELNEAADGCVDVNECVRGTHKCSSTQVCKNAHGYHICECPPGHKINENNHCEDVNECEYYRGRICSAHAECINTIGSYRCKCKEGLRERGQSCADIDECEEIPGLCQQNCVNIWGGYRCSCGRGYTLNTDNRTCTDVNECEKFKDKHLCIGTCENTPGSYICKCPSGYRLGADGRTCQDIDECEENICQRPEAICLNTRGSYKCHTIVCPPNYIRDPDHISRCKRAPNVCDVRDLQCMQLPQQYSYHFMTFVSRLPIIQGHIDFFQMKGPGWPTSTADFSMEIMDVRCPIGVEKVDDNYFKMSRYKERALISIVRSIEGPQEIELQLEMRLFYKGIFNGMVVAKIFIVVSEYTF